MERLALMLVLILAPHTKVPAVTLPYPFRPADLIILAASLAYIRWGNSRRLFAGVPAMLTCFGISVISAFWGTQLLVGLQLDRLTQDGVLVSYLPFAVRKLLLIVICFLGFQWVLSSRAFDNAKLLKYWHRGLAISVGLHVLCYLLTSEFLNRRAGVFVEGNHGGSYYLMSFFLMWWASTQGSPVGRSGMALSFLGILLAQSSTALLLVVGLSGFTVFMTPRVGKQAIGAGTVLLGTLVLLGMGAYFGGEILTKLTGEDLDPTSFSRYDRIASIASGVDMFLAYPLFGVGIQGYAFALPEYVDPFIGSFFDWNSRRIANNIYVELLAEQGLIGLAAMTAVLAAIGKPLFREMRRDPVLSAALLSVLLSWLAFPTYTISFQWIGLALIHRFAVQGLAPRTAHAVRPPIQELGGQVPSS
jgi:O-antigen ligase